MVTHITHLLLVTAGLPFICVQQSSELSPSLVFKSGKERRVSRQILKSYTIVTSCYLRYCISILSGKDTSNQKVYTRRQ